MTLHPSFQSARFTGFYALPAQAAVPAPAIAMSAFAYVGGTNSISSSFTQPAAVEPLLSVIAGLDQPHIGGSGDNILVSFTEAAPSGWVLHLSCDAAIIDLLPVYAVPQGAYNVFVPFLSESVDTATDVVLTVSLEHQSVNATMCVLPQP